MPFNDLDHEELTKILIANFNTLADEVQLLSDRNTILQYKLQYAHQEYQILADKYAPSDLEIARTLAKLQPSPNFELRTPDCASFVPLPPRKQGKTKQQTAEAIRDGRKAVQRLMVLGGKSVGSTSISGASISGASSNMRLSACRTSLSTVFEQDFTVPGKKSSLLCPFTLPPRSVRASSTTGSQRLLTPSDSKEPTVPQLGDPVCAAMYGETMSSVPPSASGSATKCPIRYLDQYSPDEIAQYFETHKHEIPRSHEVCVKRYQRNEDDIRKLDAKYGNLVSMIQGLGQKHQPMLPISDLEREGEQEELERSSNERVENWAQAVSVDSIGQGETHKPEQKDEDDRESRFDRLMKEVRVGESPSRPWGISVPIFDPPSEDQRPISPPPAPVYAEYTPKPAGKCSLDYDQSKAANESLGATMHSYQEEISPGGYSFDHEQEVKVEQVSAEPVPEIQRFEERPAGRCPFPKQEQPPMKPPPPVTQNKPAFIQPQALPQVSNNAGVPQMIFTGPVFIGYPMEQAMAFMQQYKNM